MFPQPDQMANSLLHAYTRTCNGPSAEGAKLVLLVNFLGFCTSRRHAGGGRLVPTAGDCPDA